MSSVLLALAGAAGGGAATLVAIFARYGRHALGSPKRTT